MDARSLPAQQRVLFILVSAIVWITSGFWKVRLWCFIGLFIYCFGLWVSLECISKSEGIPVYNTTAFDSVDYRALKYDGYAYRRFPTKTSSPAKGLLLFHLYKGLHL